VKRKGFILTGSKTWVGLSIGAGTLCGEAVNYVWVIGGFGKILYFLLLGLI
jgi:hypothetical protein